MAKTKTNKDRKQNVINYKNKHKRKPMNQQQELDPNVTPQPTWPANAEIKMFGAEWDAIFNFINSVSSAYAACSSVMNRAVLDGTVKMKFARIDPASGQATELKPEEEAPYQEQMANTIKQAKEIANQAVKKAHEGDGTILDANSQPIGGSELEYPSQEGLPVLDQIVDPSGNPLKAV